MDYVKRIEGTKVGWTLGMMFSLKNYMYSFVTQRMSTLRQDGYVIMLVIGIVCLIAAMISAAIVCRVRRESDTITNVQSPSYMECGKDELVEVEADQKISV